MEDVMTAGNKITGIFIWDNGQSSGFESDNG